MAKLNKVEKFYIEKNYQNMSVVELAGDCRKIVTVADVQKYIDELKAAQSQESVVTSPKTSETLAMMQTKQKGVVLMTPEVSDIGDEALKTHKTCLRRDCIQKVR